MTEILIGRERETSELRRCMDSVRSEFVIVYGRRRVGKTFLVDQFFHGRYDFAYTGGHRMSKARQLRYFAKSLKEYAHLPKQPVFKSWDDAFDALQQHLESLCSDRRKVIFIDEMPWIDTPQSEFVAALEMFWNGWASRRGDIVLIASGSSTSWMVDKLVENQGGLHARITSNIYVRPFTLHEVEQYLKSRGCEWDRYQILQAYMMLGGIPFYYSLVDAGQSLVQNIDRLFFNKNALLVAEFDELYHALFTHAGKYLAVVKLLNDSHDGMTRDQLLQATKFDSSTMTVILRNLERCDFVIKYAQFGNKAKGAIYRLVDFFTRFYFNFVETHAALDENWWSNNFQSHAVESWQGAAFELVGLTHLSQIKLKLGISGIPTAVSSWRYLPKKSAGTGKGAQIDLLIDRADRVINLCEMKFSVRPYRITDDYDKHLRERAEIFREKTKTTKALVHTFVTTMGVANAVQRSIVNSQVTMDDLFAP